MDKDGKLTVLVGGQFGSEGKGVIAHHIADEYDIHVRVGGPNAGHSFKYKDRTFKMQGVPVGWTNPEAQLVIGAGGIVDPKLLERELAEIDEFDTTVRDRLTIDPQAVVLDERMHNAEGGIHGEMHARIGSTGEGVGAARHARMSRDPEQCDLARDVPELQHFVAKQPTHRFLYDSLLEGASVLIEGTQGAGLSMVHGPWPYVTSADTNAAQLLADVGLPPSWLDETIMVVRTFPIRVAGNSGPLQYEVDWDYISSRMNKPTEERTTVTKKIRRIGRWDEELFSMALMLNDPSSIAITFMDYYSPADEGKEHYDDLTEEATDFIQYIEEYSGVTVGFIGTGGDNWALVDCR